MNDDIQLEVTAGADDPEPLLDLLVALAFGGEPVDPQLISPMNPVRKPGFDED